MNDPLVSSMLTVVWAGMLLGVVSGAVIGLFFHREDWMGGYGSFRRRLTRLGHISFFGLALVNATFALTQFMDPLSGTLAPAAWWSFTIGAATMPAVCFLTAWRKPARHLFFIPVCGVLGGILCVLIGR
jgi:hypothetical protein